MRMIRKYTVTGRVQGVGFRAFVRHSARSLGLQGTVRNLSNGAVECVACGATREILGDFEQRLRKGPPHSSVDGVACEELEARMAQALPAGFEII
jgi:acylphosphatase